MAYHLGALYPGERGHLVAHGQVVPLVALAYHGGVQGVAVRTRQDHGPARVIIFAASLAVAVAVAAAERAGGGGGGGGGAVHGVEQHSR